MHAPCFADAAKRRTYIGPDLLPAEPAMTKTEHLQVLVLMIPTFLILAAGAVSVADLTLPAL